MRARCIHIKHGDEQQMYWREGSEMRSVPAVPEVGEELRLSANPSFQKSTHSPR